MKIKAVVFDLDDTLYSEIEYVKSGFAEVEEEIKNRFGISAFDKKLFDYFLSDKNDVYGRFLRDFGISFCKQDINNLINVYRNHRPKLTLSDEVKNTLVSLRGHGYKLGILTDGRPRQQHAKIDALGLKNYVDEIIVTDELGGIRFRKPNPKSFEIMCRKFSLQPYETVYVGDNPKKDFAIKKYMPIKTVKISAGLYSGEPFSDGIKPDAYIESLSDLIKLL